MAGFFTLKFADLKDTYIFQYTIYRFSDYMIKTLVDLVTYSNNAEHIAMSKM